MLSDFPELKELFDRLMAEKDELVKAAKPYRDEYEQIHKQMEPLEVRSRELVKKFHAIERPRMVEIDQQLAAIARATGGKTLSGN